LRKHCSAVELLHVNKLVIFVIQSLVVGKAVVEYY